MCSQVVAESGGQVAGGCVNPPIPVASPTSRPRRAAPRPLLLVDPGGRGRGRGPAAPQAGTRGDWTYVLTQVEARLSFLTPGALAQARPEAQMPSDSKRISLSLSLNEHFWGWGDNTPFRASTTTSAQVSPGPSRRPACGRPRPRSTRPAHALLPGRLPRASFQRNFSFFFMDFIYLTERGSEPKQGERQAGERRAPALHPTLRDPGLSPRTMLS